MAKCKFCGAAAGWSWQPNGPGEVLTFTTLGSHYRGFAVIKVCDACKAQIEDDSNVMLLILQYRDEEKSRKPKPATPTPV